MKIYLAMVFIFLLVLIAILGVRLYILKKEIRHIGEELNNTRENGYNKQIQVSLVDKDLENMTTSINQNLDYQKHLKLKQEQSEMQLKQSISDIAHDLRTPLTVIKGYLQLLDKDNQKENLIERTDDKSQQYIDICIEKSEMLKNMVDDFFELSVLESDQREIQLKEVNATNLLMQFVLDHEAIIREKGLTPKIVLPERTIVLMGDDVLINRMLSNLLNNIFKYGKDSFELGLEEMQDKVVIYFANVIDNNALLEPKKLFERTYRGDRARNESGAGLGLYIVKLLAEKQRGEVNAEVQESTLFIKLTFNKG